MEQYFITKIKERGIKGKKIQSRGFFKDIEGLEEFVNQQVIENEAYETANDYLWAVLNDYKKRKCIICGRDITVRNYRNGKDKYCSLECYKSKDGLENAKKQRNQTNIEKYGSLDNAKNIAHKKHVESMMEKYGVENSSQIEETLNKRRDTMIERYGAATTLQASDLYKKVQETMISKYGDVTPLRNEEIKDKVRKKNLEKYGVEWSSQREDVKERVGLTHAKNRLKLLKEKLNNDDYELISDDIRNKVSGTFRCKKCGNIFSHYLYNSPRCIKCNPYIRSDAEKELYDFVKSLDVGEVINGDRKIIYPKEIDILIPQKKIGIEYNGLFWHSEKVVDNNYHTSKTIKMENNGYQLIQIFEDEWIYKKDLVKSIISAKLGKFEKRIFARQCKIREICYKDVKDFLNTNHLQGATKCKVNIGLYYDDELVSVMTFSKPRFTKEYQWELVRYCNKIGYLIVGGGSKLLSYFDKNYGGSIISYADRRFSKGLIYEKLGFKFERFTNPNYYYFTDLVRHNRMKFQKHKLKTIVENYDDKKSESEIMRELGYNRIYDCGNRVYVRR